MSFESAGADTMDGGMGIPLIPSRDPSRSKLDERDLTEDTIDRLPGLLTGDTTSSLGTLLASDALLSIVARHASGIRRLLLSIVARRAFGLRRLLFGIVARHASGIFLNILIFSLSNHAPQLLCTNITLNTLVICLHIALLVRVGVIVLLLLLEEVSSSSVSAAATVRLLARGAFLEAVSRLFRCDSLDFSARERGR